MQNSPRLTVIVTATEADFDSLRRTLSSADRLLYPQVALVVVGDEPSARLAATCAGEAVSLGGAAERYGPGDYLTGRTVGNTPFSVHLFDGEFRVFEALNLAIDETRHFTDFYLPLRAGDEIHPDAPDRLAAAFAEDVTQVGAVCCDYYLGGLRVYEEPFDRNRLRWPPAHAVSRLALDVAGVYGDDLWARLAERFVVLHLPDPLLRFAPP